MHELGVRPAFVYSCKFVDGSLRDLLLPRVVGGEIAVHEWGHEYAKDWRGHSCIRVNSWMAFV